MGIADEDSVPSHLYALLQQRGLVTMGVLNGAVPSYSLRQAVERFKREIAGRYPVVSVVVQTLDPPMTFSLLGDRWTPATSFHTRHREPQAPLLGRLEDYLDKSLVLSAALRLAYRAVDDTNRFPEPTFSDTAWRDFDAANAASLTDLIAHADGARIVLLPVNPGPDPERAYLAREREAIDTTTASSGTSRPAARTSRSSISHLVSRRIRIAPRSSSIPAATCRWRARACRPGTCSTRSSPTGWWP